MTHIAIMNSPNSDWCMSIVRGTCFEVEESSLEWLVGGQASVHP